MGWQDRDYNAGREEMKAYFANPLGLLQYALPIWHSSGLQIRLSFWFLLAAVLMTYDDLVGKTPQFVPVDVGASRPYACCMNGATGSSPGWCTAIIGSGYSGPWVE